MTAPCDAPAKNSTRHYFNYVLKLDLIKRELCQMEAIFSAKKDIQSDEQRLASAALLRNKLNAIDTRPGHQDEVTVGQIMPIIETALDRYVQGVDVMAVRVDRERLPASGDHPEGTRVVFLFTPDNDTPALRIDIGVLTHRSLDGFSFLPHPDPVTHRFTLGGHPVKDELHSLKDVFINAAIDACRNALPFLNAPTVKEQDDALNTRDKYALLLDVIDSL